MKSGNINFLERSGPLQACNGTDLPIYLFIQRSPAEPPTCTDEPSFRNTTYILLSDATPEAQI